jgi:predicted DCC family thiol-disulfide oxidoreductase YuxK
MAPRTPAQPERLLVLFDGVCNSCNWIVNRLLWLDRRDQFRFSPLQSPLGRAMRERFGIPVDRLDTLVVVDRGRAHTDSAAALVILGRLPYPYRALSWLAVFPRFLTDFFYRLYARYRYRLFGKGDTCRIPTAQERAKFLEGSEIEVFRKNSVGD